MEPFYKRSLNLAYFRPKVLDRMRYSIGFLHEADLCTLVDNIKDIATYWQTKNYSCL